MTNAATSDEASAERLERRWFAATRAASAVRAECEALVEASAQLRAQWNEARLRLLQLEQVRDSLGDELAAIDASRDPPALSPVRARARSAAA